MTLRMPINTSNLERTMNLMAALQNGELEDKVYQTVVLLGDCLPSNTKRDDLGITSNQLHYIVALAGFTREEALQFCEVAVQTGGLDSNHGSHLINRLKQRDRQAV